MENAINIENLTVSYSNADAVNGISLTVKKGEFVNIVGPNGGGKTTLIKAVLGLIKPQSGSIDILGLPLSIGKTHIGYVPQKAQTEKDFPITVLETVETAFLKSGLNFFKKTTPDEKIRAKEILKQVGLDALGDRQINQLSGGEFQRLLIARALARDPEILLLDEPCANIDPLSARKIYKLLDELNQRGITVIMVSHDLNLVISSKRRTLYINRTVLFDGEADEQIYKLH